jgi:hypothetical protein
MAAKIDIVNGALIELGETPLQSLTEDTESAITANYVYDQVYHDLLSKAPWRFAVTKQTLSQLVATPLNEWAYQYQIPSECVRVMRVYPDQDYDIYGTSIYAQSSELAVDYVAKVDEAVLPPYFVRLLVLELAVRMSISITASAQAKGTLVQEKQLQFAAALAADAQQRPNRPFLSRPFLDVRY